MAADLAAFRARFPEFADSADALVERSLEDAALIHSVRDAATLYCAAHLLTLAVGRAGEDGDEPRSEIRSEGAGPLQSTYVTMTKDGERAAFFASTSYGQTFLVLEGRAARSGIGATVVG